MYRISHRMLSAAIAGNITAVQSVVQRSLETIATIVAPTTDNNGANAHYLFAPPLTRKQETKWHLPSHLFALGDYYTVYSSMASLSDLSKHTADRVILPDPEGQSLRCALLFH